MRPRATILRWGKNPPGIFALSLTLFSAFTAIAQETGPVDEPFPEAGSKKGLQVQLVDDAINIGVQHAAINLNLSQLIDPAGKQGNPFVELDGKKYHFQQGYLSHLDRQIRPLSDRKVLLYAIMLVYHSGNPEIDRILTHPQFDPKSANRLSAFNVQTEEGRDWLKAAYGFLAQRWSRPDQAHGRVVGYIIGNEVNTHSEWSNRGNVSADEFIEEYLTAVRIASQAVRAQATFPRIYLSLDHFWNLSHKSDPLLSMPGKSLIDRFAQRARETGDFDWNVAYHPYPENLFQPAFWNDRSATFSAETPRITFKNLEVLGEYLRRPELQFEGKTRHIILSEQGFHSGEDQASLELQAAAYCLAWKKVEALPEIDAFIYHRHVDHAQEGGLNLGLWTRAPKSIATPFTKKPIHHVFTKADTPEWAEAFRFALPILNQPSWEAALESLKK